jgi:methionine-rich copper-binding protein CopC
VRTTSPPERVELRFSEPVEAEFDPVVVRAADGVRVDAHDARVDPDDARIVLADLHALGDVAAHAISLSLVITENRPNQLNFRTHQDGLVCTQANS